MIITFFFTTIVSRPSKGWRSAGAPVMKFDSKQLMIDFNPIAKQMMIDFNPMTKQLAIDFNPMTKQMMIDCNPVYISLLKLYYL